MGCIWADLEPSAVLKRTLRAAGGQRRRTGRLSPPAINRGTATVLQASGADPARLQSPIGPYERLRLRKDSLGMPLSEVQYEDEEFSSRSRSGLNDLYFQQAAAEGGRSGAGYNQRWCSNHKRPGQILWLPA